jgi:hypothetical protein
MSGDAEVSGRTKNDLAETIRKGFFGDAEEVQAASAALDVFVSRLDQLEAERETWRARYGEAVADPLTELRLRLQRGE